MFELVAILTFLGVALLVITVIAAIGFVLKVAFKLVLLPFWLLGVLLKGVLVVGAVLLAIAAAPFVLLVVLVALPLAALAGLVGFGIWVVA